jgi:hypothetical protein
MIPGVEVSVDQAGRGDKPLRVDALIALPDGAGRLDRHDAVAADQNIVAVGRDRSPVAHHGRTTQQHTRHPALPDGSG